MPISNAEVVASNVAREERRGAIGLTCNAVLCERLMLLFSTILTVIDSLPEDSKCRQV